MKVVSEIPLFLSISIASICLLMVSLFRMQNRLLVHAFLKRIKHMDELIAKHGFQIRYRQKGLDTYDFILQNLKEALKIQKDIEL
ncbi:MAG: hypothetical protein KTR22_07295 [Flavobacteriaceae bacterium]|nr:hypothetical protein [Flavobacteriaceae bacterium]